MPEAYRDKLQMLADVPDLTPPAIDFSMSEEVRVRAEPVRSLVRWTRPFHAMQFQSELIEDLADAGSGWARLLVLPTGAGKTAVAAISVLNWLAETRATVVWIAPQRELVSQANGVIARMWETGYGPDSLDLVVLPAGVGAIRGDRARVLFATPQLFLRNPDLFRLVQSSSPLAVVVDEAHHFGADAFASVIYPLARDGVRLLGLSATPRASSKSARLAVEEIFPDGLLMSRRLGKNPTVELQRLGVLARAIHLDLDVPEAKRSGIYSYASRWKLRDLVTDCDRWNATLDHISSNANSDRQIVCCLDRAHGVALTHALRARGMASVAYIDGEYSLADRAAVFEAFHLGRVTTLVQVQLVMEGVDLPRADSLVLTHPIGSEVEATQAIGRVLRGPKVGGTEISKVVSSDIDQTWIDEMLNLGDLPLSGWVIRWV